jgi:hypothetical protein
MMACVKLRLFSIFLHSDDVYNFFQRPQKESLSHNYEVFENDYIYQYNPQRRSCIKHLSSKHVDTKLLGVEIHF